MSQLEGLAVLTRENAAITYAAAGDDAKVREQWDALVALVRNLSVTKAQPEKEQK